MTEPSAKIILDSVTHTGERVTTVELTHHRFILAEMNTHGAVAKNSASSRAIPLSKMMKKFETDSAYPAAYRSEQPGMSGGADLDDVDRASAEMLFSLWNTVTGRAITDYVEEIKARYPGEDENGKPLYLQHILHKSWVNRLMEPMQWHTALWTFDHNLLNNLISQRLHKDAQPEFYEVMKVLVPLLKESEPQVLGYDKWHTPLIRPEDKDDIWNLAVSLSDLGVKTPPIIIRDELTRKISVARCARVSYLTHDGVRDLSEDLKLYSKLADQNPPHASPFEHVATPANWNKQMVEVPQMIGGVKVYRRPKIGKFYGWLQLRHAMGMS